MSEVVYPDGSEAHNRGGDGRFIGWLENRILDCLLPNEGKLVTWDEIGCRVYGLEEEWPENWRRNVGDVLVKMRKEGHRVKAQNRIGLWYLGRV